MAFSSTKDSQSRKLEARSAPPDGPPADQPQSDRPFSKLNDLVSRLPDNERGLSEHQGAQDPSTSARRSPARRIHLELEGNGSARPRSPAPSNRSQYRGPTKAKRGFRSNRRSREGGGDPSVRAARIFRSLPLDEEPISKAPAKPAQPPPHAEAPPAQSPSVEPAVTEPITTKLEIPSEPEVPASPFVVVNRTSDRTGSSGGAAPSLSAAETPAQSRRFSSSRLVAYRRRRRRHLPINPWTDAEAIARPSQAQQSKIKACLEGLAEILRKQQARPTAAPAPQVPQAPASTPPPEPRSAPAPLQSEPSPQFPLPPFKEQNLPGIPLEDAPQGEGPPPSSAERPEATPFAKVPDPVTREPVAWQTPPPQAQAPRPSATPAPDPPTEPLAAPSPPPQAEPIPQTAPTCPAPPETSAAGRGEIPVEGAGLPPLSTEPPGSPTITEAPGPANTPAAPVAERIASPSPAPESPFEAPPDVKLVPRVVTDPKTYPKKAEPTHAEPPAVFSEKKANLEITAPTTLVGSEAPISPFTKVAKGTAADLTPKTPAAFPKPEQGDFPLQSPSAKATSPSSPFASPFSSGVTKPSATAASATSIAGERTTEGPSKRPHSISKARAGTAGSRGNFVPMSASLGGAAVGPTASAAAGVARLKAEPRIKKRKTRRAARPMPEARSWGVLTWLFAGVSLLYLGTWSFEVLQTLKRSTAPATPPVAPRIPDDGASSGPVLPNIDLSQPLDCLNQYFEADSEELRRFYVVEGKDPQLPETMRAHHAEFPHANATPEQIVNGGIFRDSYRDYLVAPVKLEDDRTIQVRLIGDERGDFRFSWFAFEQARSQLLRRYHETSWTGWTHFFVELRPLKAESLPDGVILENLYYRLTVPEDPDFEAIAYVDENSSMVDRFRTTFRSTRSYEVIVDLQRNAPLLDDDRPVFRVTRLVKESWDPGS